MPAGKTHLAIGLGTGLALGSALSPGPDFPWRLGLTVALAGLGALAPDLDIDDNELEEMGRDRGRQAARHLRRLGSRGGGVWKMTATAAGALVLLLGEIASRLVEAVSFVIQRFTTHRGITHSLLAMVLVTALGVGLSSWLSPQGNIWWGLAWGAGYGSHLMADALTWSGVKFFQPWSRRSFWLAPRALRFRVGTWPDGMLRAVSPFAGALFLLWRQGIWERLAALAG